MSLIRAILACLGLCLMLSGMVSVAKAQTYPDFVRKSVYVTVRDGVRLAVNIYRPATNGAVEQGPLPVIFAFTPYRARFVDKDGQVVELALKDRLGLRSLIRAGYVVAVADIRGKGASFGHRHGFQSRQEAQDGYELVEWLASQPFSTGKVGMIGCSYLGGTTFQTASTAPPSLKAIFVGGAELDKYAFVRNGGITAQFNTRPDEPLEQDLASVPVDDDPDGVLLKQAVAQHSANTSMSGLWYSMPYRDSVSPLTGNAFWEEVGLYNYLDTMRRAGIATYFWSNWEDEPTAQMILAAKNLNGKLLVGPGSHCNPPPGSDFTNRITAYFDHYLKGVDNGIEREPRASYWVEGQGGTGAYAVSDSLPGENAKPLAFYLEAGDGVGAGGLSTAAAKSGQSGFTTDYDNIPSSEYFSFWVKPMGEHGLSYVSAPLVLPLKLVGYPVARLDVKASTPDAPVFVYLEEVSSEGDAYVVAFGRLLMSQREVSEAPYNTLGLPYHSGLKVDAKPTKPGEKVRLDIALTPIARVVQPGSRLRFVVTGADPRQRNLQDIRLDPAPQITVFSGSKNGSRIDLPVAP
ncbi:MAG: CocE/NonD family hydrolase [Sphingomonadaceae bacterium]